MLPIQFILILSVHHSLCQYPKIVWKYLLILKDMLRILHWSCHWRQKLSSSVIFPFRAVCLSLNGNKSRKEVRWHKMEVRLLTSFVLGQTVTKKHLHATSSPIWNGRDRHLFPWRCDFFLLIYLRWSSKFHLLLIERLWS